MRSFRLGAVCAGFAACAALFAAAPAMATVTSSTITSITTPDGFTASPVGSQLFSGWSSTDPTHQNMVVSGTVITDDNNAGDTVDVRCYYGDGGGYDPIQAGVTVNSDGTFTTDPQNFSDETCHLGAVDPSYSNPLDSSTFRGPIYGVGYQEDDYTINGGPNDGQRYDYFSDGHQSKGYFEWDSSGDCGATWSQVFDGPFYNYDDYSPFDCALALYSYSGGDGYGRSEVQVDGKNAYNSYGAASLSDDGNGHVPRDNGNFPALSWTNNVDPATGDMTVTESEPLVDCGSASFPASAQCDAADNSSQASFHPSGVRFDRTIKQSKDGLQATVTDTYTSTDGAQHAIDVEYDNYSDEDDKVNYDVPGSSGFKLYCSGDSVDLPAKAVGSILIQDTEYGDGNPEDEIPGAVTYLTQPDRMFFNGGCQGSTGEFVLGYKRSVSAGGSLSITHVLSQAADMVHVRALAGQAEDAAQPPAVSIDSPASDSTVASDTVTVIGKAVDDSGAVALKVNGIPTPVAPDGTWSQRVPLSAGGNTITAVATDPAGNSAQASETLNYVAAKSSCAVPTLVGLTANQAVAALEAAACGVGKQKAVYSGNVKSGNVAAQGSAPGTLLTIGTPVGFSVSRGAFPSARLASSKVRLKGTRLIIAVRCSKTGSATNGTIKLRKTSGKHQTLGTKSFQCPSGKARNVIFTFSKKTAAAFHKANKSRVAAYIVSRGPDGAAASRTSNMTVLG